MKLNLFFLSLLGVLVSLQSFSQTRHQMADEPFVVYRIDEKNVSINELKDVTDGKIEAFHGREKIEAFLKDGYLYDAFSSMNFEGFFSEGSSFSVQDKKQNFARGEVVCSGIDTFKAFTNYLVTSEKEKKEELYKCLSFSKASYIASEGTYFLEGGFSFPILMKDTTVSFMPNKGVFSPLMDNFPSVKNISFNMFKDAHKLDVAYQFSNDKKISFSYDFIESYLPEFIHSPFDFLKEVLLLGNKGNFNLKEVRIPTLTGKTGLLFQGDFNSKKGVLNQSNLSLFLDNEQKFSEISYLNDSFFLDIKYPLSLTSFIEGEVKNLNSDNAYLKFSKFIQSFLNNPFKSFSLPEIATLLSGLEFKNVTVYDINHEKQAIFNLKIKSNITEQMLKEIQKDVKLMDLLMTGEIVLFGMPTGEMKISFNESDEVQVNGISEHGKNVADFYWILKHLQKKMDESLEVYSFQLGGVFDNVFILGPLFRRIESGLKIKNILNAARKVALKNYTYCVSQLENEKIDFMADCKGIDPSKIKGYEMPKNVEISLPDTLHQPLISSDERTGRDLIYLTLKFKDQNFCEQTAKEKKSTCFQNETTVSFPTDLKTY